MKWWPWGGHDPVDGGPTARWLAFRAAAVAGTLDAVDPAEASAVAAASSAYGDALASATIEADSTIAHALDPGLLGYLGRRYPSHGEASLLITVSNDVLALVPVEIERIAGDTFHTIREDGDRTLRRTVSEEEIVHIVFERSSQSRRGRAPWTRAPAATAALASLERTIAIEAAGPVFQAWSTPGDLKGDAAALMESGPLASMNKAQGGVVRVPVQTDSGVLQPLDSTRVPSTREGVFTRVAPTFSANHSLIHAQLAAVVAATCGLPPGLLSANVASAGLRESLRSFVALKVTPIAKLIELELQRKLDPALTLDVSPPPGLDIVTRSRAVHSLAAAGVAVDEALAIAGIEVPA